MNDTYDPNELVSLLFGESSDNHDGTWRGSLPEEMYYVPGDAELFSYGHVFITANEAFQLEQYTTFDEETKRLWTHQAREYLKLTAPEYLDIDIFDGGDDFDFGGTENFEPGLFEDNGPRLTFDEIFAARESGFVSDTWDHKFGPFNVPADHRENWENHPILAQVRSDPKKWHLIPDWTGTVGISLSALQIYGWIEYKRHDKIRAYYVKAKG